jgi:hypothetical protein
MFIAVTFMCMIGGECRFVYDHTATTEKDCLERNAVLAQLLEANDDVAAYRATCVPIPKEEYNARS